MKIILKGKLLRVQSMSVRIWCYMVYGGLVLVGIYVDVVEFL